MRSCTNADCSRSGRLRRKEKRRRRLRIELRRIGNRVPEILVQRRIVGFQARLPLMPPARYADRAAHISFAEAVVLEDLDRRRVVIRIETDCVVAHHRADIRDHARRKRVLVRRDSHRLNVAGRFQLRSQRKRRIERVEDAVFAAPAHSAIRSAPTRAARSG